MQTEAGDHAEAIRTWNAAVAAEPKEPGLLAERGIAHARAGSMALAEKDFAAARAMSGSAAQDATALNNICWAKATAGLLLQSALADCDAALGKLPDAPAYLDSRGLVLLRLGRLDEAIATYDRALAKAPRQTSSLWGRSIAWARKGDRARSATDAAAALKNNLDVRTEFEAYGVKP